MTIENKDLSRYAVWNWHDSAKIYILKNKEKCILSNWQTLVFFYADGCNTAYEIAKSLKRDHDMKSYDSEVLKATQELLNMGAIIYTDNSYKIPYNHYVSIDDYSVKDEAEYNR